MSADLRYDPPTDPGLAAELEYRAEPAPGEEGSYGLPDDRDGGLATPSAIIAMALAALAVLWWIASKRSVRG